MTMTNVSPEQVFNAGTPTRAASEPIVTVRDLSVEFITEHGWQRVVNDVSLDLVPGKIMGVVGESGSGKSVTSLALMGLLPARGARMARGSIEFDGVDLSTLSKRELADMRGNEMAMIFQEPMTSLNPAFTIGEQIAETVRRHLGLKRKAAWARAVEALDDVGIPNAARRAERYPHEFSGGMRQRAMIAMAISCKPRLLIADEPTTALDVTIQDQILQLLREMCVGGDLAMMFITHDMAVVADICDDVTVMYAGEVVESSSVDSIFAKPQHPYTEGLLRSVPTLGNQGTLISIPGSTPAPWNMPPGCRFHPRCPYGEDSCSDAPLPLSLVGGHPTRCALAAKIYAGAQR